MKLTLSVSGFPRGVIERFKKFSIYFSICIRVRVMGMSWMVGLIIVGMTYYI